MTDGTLSYFYSDRGRLQRVNNRNKVLSKYTYNGLEQRVTKTVGTALTQYVYDEQGQLLGEYDSAGKLLQETVYLGNKPIAVLKQSVSRSVVSTNIHYVYTDHINTPRIISE